MKEIVIISGKGGTGKTSFAASLAYLGGSDVVVVDCDVDAADMHLLLKPDFAKSEEFFSGELAVIDQEECIKCGKCKEVCRFDAIPITNNQYIVDPLSCEGCGYCARVCPVKAITNEDLNVGNWYVSNTKINNTLVHAKLGIGADNSGKLVAKVKEEVRKTFGYMAAVDKYYKAANVTNKENVKTAANQKAAGAASNYPETALLFFHGYSKGQSVTVGCWIQEPITIKAID